MTWRGLVEWIETETPRGFIASDQTAGATSLPCSDGDAFLSADDSGTDVGEVVIDGETYDFTSVTISDDESVTPSTLVISPGLLADQESGTPIDLVSDAESRFAGVSADNGIGDVLSARIPHNLAAYASLVDGTYEGDARLTVDVDRVNGELVIVNVVDQIPKIAGSTIDGPIPAGSQPDPVAPASSPLPVLVGLLRQILATVTGIENATPVVYEYHVAITNASPPDSTTLVVETPSTSVSLTKLQDGSALAYDTDYYVAVVAKSGDQAADPSAWVLGRLDRAGTPDITVGSITGDLFASIVAVSSLFRTAAVGQRTENDISGFRVYDSTGALVVNLSPSEVIVLANYMYALYLETGGARLGGLTTGPPGGEFALGTGILEAPSLPLSHQSTITALDISGGGEGGNGYPKLACDDVGADVWKFFTSDDHKKLLFRRYSWAGALLSSGTVTTLSSGEIDFIHGACMTPDNGYFSIRLDDGTRRIWRIARPTATTWSSTRGTTSPPAAPGTGGYEVYDLVVGVQRGTDDILLSHRVQGAQTISGQVYADQEVMVRRYTPSGTGTTLTLTLNKTIKTGIVPTFDCSGVQAENTSGTYDTPADSGKTSLYLITDEVDHHIINFANSGATVTASAALALNSWEFSDVSYAAWGGCLYDGTKFWAIFTLTNGTAALYELSDAVGVDPCYHSYDYYNGVEKTEMAPTTDSAVLTRRHSTWTIPTLPSGVDEVRLYMSADETTRTRYERVGTSFPGTTGAPLLIATDPIVPPAGAATNPPTATSDYPGGSVYTITTADSDTHMDGDGGMYARDPATDTEVVNLRTLIGTVANVAALPGSGDYEGQRIYCTATKEIAVWNGSEWTEIWKDYTPTWTNRTAGTGASLLNAARYVRRGNSYEMEYQMRLGTSGAFTGVPTMSLPATPFAATLAKDIGVCRMVDDNASVRRHGVVQLAAGASVVTFELENGTPIGVQTSATAPWTWAVNDYIAGRLSFEGTP